jgi:hypothetical protein
VTEYSFLFFEVKILHHLKRKKKHWLVLNSKLCKEFDVQEKGSNGYLAAFEMFK